MWKRDCPTDVAELAPGFLIPCASCGAVHCRFHCTRVDQDSVDQHDGAHAAASPPEVVQEPRFTACSRCPQSSRYSASYDSEFEAEVKPLHGVCI